MLLPIYLTGVAAMAGFMFLAALDNWRDWEWRTFLGVFTSVVLWPLLPVFALLSLLCIIMFRVDNKGAMYEPRIHP